jgi:hypothetical protein
VEVAIFATKCADKDNGKSRDNGKKTTADFSTAAANAPPSVEMTNLMVSGKLPRTMGCND